MKITRRVALKTGLGTALSALSVLTLRAEDALLFDIAEGAEDFWLATDAYIYGYPLVTVEMTRRVVTNRPRVEGSRGPMNQIISLRQYPDASYRDVTSPNADTLYSSGFFYVDKEPWVLSVPDMKVDISYCRCLTDGPPFLLCRAHERQELERKPTRLPVQTGAVPCLRVSRN
jgi:hypothetical protein